MRRSFSRGDIFARLLRCEPLEDRRMLSITLFVDSDAAPTGDGLAWSSAYNDLQSALSQAAAFNADTTPSNDVDQIWIAEGTYKPSAELEPGDVRSASFSLVDDVDLYGGFAGNETTLEARDWSTHVTTLSGDLGVLEDDSDNAYTVVYCGNDIEAAIDGVSITRGNANGSSHTSYDRERRDGGGIFNFGTLRVTNATLSGNSSDYVGGGIFNGGSGDLVVTDSTFWGNSSDDSGGGIYNAGSELTVANTKLFGNLAKYGGGISGYSTITITNSTLAGNLAEKGGGINTSSGTLTLANSIVCLNSENDIHGNFAGLNNLTNIDPAFVRKPSAGADGEWGTADDDLGDLRLSNISPAINAGSNQLAVDSAGNPLIVDCDGNPRIADGTVDIGAYEHQGPPAAGRETPSLLVSSADDLLDLYDGEITLREAIYYSRSGIGDGTVTFDAALDGTTITLAAGELRLSHPIVIDASALSSLTVDGNNCSRVFYVEGNVTLSGLTINGGLAKNGGGIYTKGTLTVLNTTVCNSSANEYGGGIYNSGTLTVMNSTIDDNTASKRGGGIFNDGTLIVTNSTFSENLAKSSIYPNLDEPCGGGGIYNSGTTTVTYSILRRNSAFDDGGGFFNIGMLTLTNSLLSQNLADNGGGIYNSPGGGFFNIPPGTLAVTNSTLAGNSADSGGGIYNGGTLTVTNSIVCSNSGSDIQGNFYNTNNLISVDPGFVRTPSAGVDNVWGTFDDDPGDLHLTDRSPAIDIGSNLLAVDAAGSPLTMDLDDSPRIANGTVDIGAYEYQGPPAPELEIPSLIVSTVDDVFDLYDGEISLREAIYYSQSGIGDGMVSFNAELDAATITLAGDELRINDPIMIDASALSSLTVDADNRSRAFYIDSDVTLSSLTITGGSVSGIYNSGNLTVRDSVIKRNSGVGISNESGTLSITNSIIANNGDHGIYNVYGTLTVTTCTISGNSADHYGGGIYNSSGTLTLANSVVVGNSAKYGGGIDSYGKTTITNSTIVGNSAGDGGGVYSNSSLTITNTIVCLNAGGDIHSSIGSIDGSNNLANIAPGFVRAPSAGTDGELGTEDDDQGDLRLTNRSPAINAGGNSLAIDAFDNLLTTDLDNNPRIADGTVDIGAYEYQGSPASGREIPSLVISVADDEFDLYDGEITLREAIYYSRSGIGNGTITFDAALDDATINLAGQELQINHPIVIDALALSSLTVDANNRSRVFYIDNNVTIVGLTITGGSASSGGGIYNNGMLTLVSSTLSNNSADHGGGGIYNSYGSLTLTNSVLSGNSAGGGGGGIDNFGTLTVTNCTIRDNSSDSAGGGIYNSYTSWLTVTNSTFLDNTANSGGGIYNGGGTYSSGLLTLTNCTLAGNMAKQCGGGICNTANPFNTPNRQTVTNSTLAGNSADKGGGIYNSYDDTLTINNSIICLNYGQDIKGNFDGSNNLSNIDPGFVRMPSAGTDGKWGTTDDDPGDLHLAEISLAINAGNNLLAVDVIGNPLTSDLDGYPRIANGTIDIGAYEYQGPPATGRETPSLVVSVADDEFDVYDGEITLREAIYYSQTGSGDGTITFDAALDGATIVLAGWELVISHSIVIDALALSSLTVDAGNRSRVFFIEDDVTLSGLTITGGSADDGSGIFNTSTLKVLNTTLAYNSADQHGGGIYSDGTLTVTNSTFASNLATEDGGGIYNDGTLTITNTTLSGNLATDGGGIYNGNMLTVTNSTIAGNSANEGGGIFGFNGTLTVTNSIVCQNSGGGIQGDFDGSNNLTNMDPGFVRAPSAGADGNWGTSDDDPGDLRLTDRSLAINVGSNLLAIDAAGNPLTNDLDGNPRIADSIVDIGAYEYQGLPAAGRETPSLVVSVADDEFDLYDGEITLREAIYYSQSGIGDGTITFEAALDGATITLTGLELEISHSVIINASALSSITVDANNRSRVFYINDDVTLCGLTITGGSTGSNGGGILNSGTLTLIGSTLSSNSALSGGGIYNLGTMTVMNSSLVGNSAGSGGGVFNNGTLMVANSMFSGNLAGYDDGSISFIFDGGGGICNSSSGTLTVTNSTISGNSAENNGGGIFNGHHGMFDGLGGYNTVYGTLTITNSILALNVATDGSDYFGELTPESSNLISNDPLFVRNPSDGGDGWVDDPDTSEIDESANNDYGDLRLKPGSPAINAGSNLLAVDADGNPLATDFSGNPRIMIGTVDIGAYEYVPRVDISAVIVTEPTTLDSDGESDSLPEGADWIDEWQSFWVEIWVNMPDTDDIPVAGVSIDLKYNTEYCTATGYEYGDGFDLTPAPSPTTIDDTTGTIITLVASPWQENVADDRPALFVRVRFEPKVDEMGVPFGVAAVGTGIILESPHVNLVGSLPCAARLLDMPNTILRAVPYDLDRNGVISLGDLSHFASVYREKPGVTTESPYAYAADFDHSGTVDLGDLAFFASNYQQARPNGSIVYPSAFGQSGLVAPQPSLTVASSTVAKTPAIICSDDLKGSFDGDERVTDTDVAMLAQHWMMTVEDLDNDKEDDASRAVFAAAGASGDLLGLLDE